MPGEAWTTSRSTATASGCDRRRAPRGGALRSLSLDWGRDRTPAPSVGWGVLHLFCKLADAPPRRPAPVRPRAVVQAVKDAEGDEVQVVTVAMLGHKADICVMALGPDLWRLRRLQSDLQAAGLVVVDSYVSLTEVSEYAAGVPDEMKQVRLYPAAPARGEDRLLLLPDVEAPGRRRGGPTGSPSPSRSARS